MKDSNELFELCKQVYEATGWDDTQNGYYNIDGKEPLLYDKDNFDIHKEPWWGQMAYLSPAYTSDYLLEKLPSRIQDENGNYFSLMGFPNGVQLWFAYKGGLDGEDSRWPIDKGIPYYQRVFQANTPLKALLKLTLKLHEEGLL